MICAPELTREWTPCSRAAWHRRRKQLLKRGLAENKTAMQAIGYRQWWNTCGISIRWKKRLPWSSNAPVNSQAAG